MWGPKLLDMVSKGALIFNIVSFVVPVVTILALQQEQAVSIVCIQGLSELDGIQCIDGWNYWYFAASFWDVLLLSVPLKPFHGKSITDCPR